MTSKAPHIRKGNRLKPELGIPASVGYVDVRRLPSFHAEEEESVSTNPQQHRHKKQFTAVPSIIEALGDSMVRLTAIKLS
jgi:hypothetical protein